ncbi:MAG: glycosyltransferase family 2 protein [Clostridiales bacterium]|nr:glycosyltransferase family 2 protein [Clostridiales bacterium]
MQSAELSVIFPVRNLEKEISGILHWVSAQTAGLETELIVVDMGSDDRTVLEAVQKIKERGLRGFVIQNGETTVASALNTGIQKAGGDYVTFLFAGRLYRGFAPCYMETAVRSGADFVYGCMTEEESRTAERRLVSSAVCREQGATLVFNMIKGTLRMDISAVFIRRAFLMEKQIRFTDSCGYGYSEEFVYRCLLEAESAVQAPVVLHREKECEMKRGRQQPVGKNIFQYADAMLRVADLVRTGSTEDLKLVALFEQQKLPLTVMHGVDVMLQEGVGYNAVRGFLRVNGYDKYLKTGRKTAKSLKRRIAVWKMIPWMYQPK